jgi:hypothetical protein
LNNWVTRPLIDGSGTIYGVGSVNPGDYNWQYILFAINANGVEKWSLNLGWAPSWNILGNNGQIILGTYGHVAGVSPAGQLLWSTPLTGAFYAPVMASNSQIIIDERYALTDSSNVVHYYGRIVGLDSTGNRVWSSPGVEATTISQPMAIGQNGIIYAPWGTYMRRFTLDGSELPSVDLGGSITASPVISSTGIIYVSVAGALVALDPGTNLPKWRYTVADNGFLGPALGPDGSIYCVWTSHGLIALTQEGTLSWLCPMQSICASGAPLVDAAGTIYFSQCVEIVAVDPTGHTKWTLSNGYNGGGVGENFALGPDGRIYIFSGGGTVYAQGQ